MSQIYTWIVWIIIIILIDLGVLYSFVTYCPIYITRSEYKLHVENNTDKN